METEIFACDCGGQVRMQNGKGRYFSAGDYGKVLLTHKHMLEICDSCGSVYTKGGDHSLQEKLRASVTDNVVALIDHITSSHGLREAQIGFFLGLTPQSLSRCKNESSNRQMASQSFLLLKGLAANGREFFNSLLNLEVEIRGVQRSAGAGSLVEYDRSKSISAKML